MKDEKTKIKQEKIIELTSSFCDEKLDDEYKELSIKLVEKLGLCVLNCEEYGLTRSAVDPNRCTEFDADAVLINVAEGVPIDVNNFNEIVAKVTAATSTGYTTNWVLNEEKTKELNDDPDMTFDTYPWTDFGTEHEAPDVVIGKEFSTPLDTTFFQLDKYYSFDLEPFLIFYSLLVLWYNHYFLYYS